MTASLIAKLAAARRRLRLVEAVGGLAAALACLIALALVCFYVDRLVALTTTGRAVWLGVLTAVPGLWLLVTAARAMLRRIPDDALAAEVERHHTVLGERLLTAVELAHPGGAAGVSVPLVGQVALDAERVSAPLNFAGAVPLRRVRRPLLFACAAVTVLAAHVLIAPQPLRVWLDRLLHPYADIPIFARTLVWVLPGDRVVPRGQTVLLGVKTTGRAADAAVLRYRPEGGGWTEVLLTTPRPTMDGGRRFAYRVADLQQTITYYATANDGRANAHHIRVEDRPTILGVRLRLQYPAYTGRPAETLQATTGNVVAPIGTRVEVAATANKRLREALYLVNGRPRGPWSVTDATITGGFGVTGDRTYGFRLLDHNGFEGLDPPQYTVRAQPDLPPTVQITRPAGDLERGPTGSVPLRLVARDDYGVSSLRISWRVGKRTGDLPIPGADGHRQVAAGGSWDLGPLGLRAGDLVTYQAVARDNDSVTGPNTGRSGTYRIRIVGSQEVRERLDTQASREQEALRDLIRQHAAAQAALEKGQQMPGKPALQEARALERAAARQAADLAQRMQQTTDQMRENGLGMPAQLQRRDGAQAALRDLGARRMPEAAANIERGALPTAAAQERRIAQDLQRIAGEVGQAPDAAQLAQEAARLAQAQRALADRSALAADRQEPGRPDRAELRSQAREQASLRAQTEALEQGLQQAARDARERGQTSASALQQASQEMRQAAVPRGQSAAMSSLQAARPSQASQQQNAAAADLQRTADRLEDIAANARAGQSQQNAARMLEAAERLQQMARAEEQIATQAQGSPDTGTLARMSRDQQALMAQAQAVAPQIAGAPQASQALTDARGSMQQAAGHLGRRAPQAAAPPARQAAHQLFQAASQAHEAARQMQGQQQAQAAQRAVEALAREQRALEQSTARIDSARRGPNLTDEQRRQVTALSQQQGQLPGRIEQLVPQMPSDTFRWALREASRRMWQAQGALGQQQTGLETQRTQEHAAQSLERVARALGRQARASEQASQAGGDPQDPTQQAARAAGEIDLLREVETQVRQETGALEQARDRAPQRQMTGEQQRQLNDLANTQNDLRWQTDRLSRQMQSLPETGGTLQRAAVEMEDVRVLLQRQQTEAPTQGKQEHIIATLQQAAEQTQQAMRQQRQQTAAQQQPQGQPTQQNQPQQRSAQPAQRTTAPVVRAQPGAFGPVGLRGRGFGGLSPRALQALQEGRQERVPAEYREIVNQYFRALGERR